MDQPVTFLLFLLLLTSSGRAVAYCLDCSALYELLTSDCPAEPLGSPPVPALSEAECTLRCTLRPECRISVYFRGLAACHGLAALPLPAATGGCSSRIVARRKLVSATAEVQALSFASQILMFFNFMKGYGNLANPSLYRADPVSVSEQSSIDGVRLKNSSNSHVRISTPGLSRLFNTKQSLSFFFQGKSSLSYQAKCISAFPGNGSEVNASRIYARADGKLTAEVFFPTSYFNWSSAPVSPQGLFSLGLNFQGAGFAGQAYFNGSALPYSAIGSIEGMSFKVGPDSFDVLTIGSCMRSDIGQFDGWLQCWGLLTGSLSMGQFGELERLCRA